MQDNKLAELLSQPLVDTSTLIHELEASINKLEAKEREILNIHGKDIMVLEKISNERPGSHGLYREKDLVNDLHLLHQHINSGKWEQGAHCARNIEQQLPDRVRTLAMYDSEEQRETSPNATDKIGLVKSMLTILREHLAKTEIKHLIQAGEISKTSPIEQLSNARREQRRSILHILDVFLDPETLLNIYVDMREREVEVLVPALFNNKIIDLKELEALSAACLCLIKEDWYMLSELFTASYIEELYSTLYLLRYTDIFMRNIHSSTTLESICQQYNIAQQFQDTVRSLAYIADDENEMPLPKDPPTPSGKRRQQTSALNRSNTPPPSSILISGRRRSEMQLQTVLSQPRLLQRRSNTITNLVDTIQEFNQTANVSLDFVDKAFSSIINDKMIKGYLQSLFQYHDDDMNFDRYLREQVFVLPHTRQIFERLTYFAGYMHKAGFIGMRKPFIQYAKHHIYYYIESLLERYSDPISMYYVYNSILYAMNQMTIMDHDSWLSNVQVHSQRVLVKVHDHIIDHHMYYINAHILVDVQLSDWESYRTYMSDTRCTYGVQMWYYYLLGVHHDISTFCVSQYGHEIFGQVVIRSLASIFDIYTHLYPGRVRTAQLERDLTIIVIYARSLRACIPPSMAREMNHSIIRLFVYMAFMLAPLDIVQDFIDTPNHEQVQNASRFAASFEDQVIHGIPVSVWEPPCHHYSPIFDPIHAFCSLANEYVANTVYDWRAILDGWYVVGMSRNELVSRIRGRKEYIENDYPSWTPQDAQNLERLEQSLKLFI